VLIARAPVRVSFFGGGTDLPAYYLRQPEGGAVLSATINKHVYVILSVSEQHELQITSSDYRTFYRHPRGEPLLWDGDLSLPRAVLHHFGVRQGLNMFLASEVPPGTGLGSSGSITVALVKAMSAACGLRLSRQQIAERACEVEIEKLGKPVGVQDQYAAAFGGFNWMTFSRDGIKVERLDLPALTTNRLQSNLVLAFTGSARDSAVILQQQSRASGSGDPIVTAALNRVHELAFEAREDLLAGDLHSFGLLLDQAWQQKRQFAPGVTNEKIERCYALARRNGALGGKVAGAGGGGFLTLFCDDGSADRVRSALEKDNVRCLDFNFESDGARVLFNAGLRLPADSFARSV
jgi:D-glycero-alpha-D-manno-heptose-7-phosphate kinase